VIGRLHAQTIQALAPRAELVAVVDRGYERATALASEFGVAAETDPAAVLARDDIDAVTICLPSGQHADAAVAALEHGKHVIIEKPIDITLDAARRIRDAEAGSSATAMVVSQHRHDRASQVVHAAARAGRFGRITSGAAQMPWWRSQAYYDSGDWRGTWALDGGGALMNQGHHSIDLLVWFLGEPVEVFARTNRLAHERIEVEDVAVATIRFADGALGVVHATTAAYPGLRATVGVYGERGSAVLEDDRLVYFHAAEGDEPQAYDYGAAGGANLAAKVLPTSALAPGAPPIAGLATTSHTAQFIDFLDAVEQGRPPVVTTEEAIRTLAVICGMYESVRTNALVRLSEL
jgi:UDP-N-acetyl-2-amino-2-deoxyglucuronate dehydrogenase